MEKNNLSLHAALAIESGLESQANKLRSELMATFGGKRHLFEGKSNVFTPVEEGAVAVAEESRKINTTVPKEIKWLTPFLEKALDSSYRIAEANTAAEARADIILDDGAVLASKVPATYLLELEKKLGEIKVFIDTIPTLDPAKDFVPDTQLGDGHFKAREIVKTRTRKEKVTITLYPATVEHPAQVQLIDKDITIGTIRETEWSGLITPAQKSIYLERVELVIRAVRKARSRANDAKVDDSKKIGNAVLAAIFG